MAAKTTKPATTKDENTKDAVNQDALVDDTGGGADAGTGEALSDGGNDPSATVDDSGDEDGETTSEGVNMSARKAVVFLGPHHRYSRGDTACFDAVHAEDLVERHIAVWPEDAKKALAPRKGGNDFDTDIG